MGGACTKTGTPFATNASTTRRVPITLTRYISSGSWAGTSSQARCTTTPAPVKAGARASSATPQRPAPVGAGEGRCQVVFGNVQCVPLDPGVRAGWQPAGDAHDGRDLRLGEEL